MSVTVASFGSSHPLKEPTRTLDSLDLVLSSLSGLNNIKGLGRLTGLGVGKVETGGIHKLQRLTRRKEANWATVLRFLKRTTRISEGRNPPCPALSVMDLSETDAVNGTGGQHRSE